MNDAQRIPLVRAEFARMAKASETDPEYQASLKRGYPDYFQNQDLSDDGITKAINRVRRGTALANPVDAAARAVIYP